MFRMILFNLLLFLCAHILARILKWYYRLTHKQTEIMYDQLVDLLHFSIGCIVPLQYFIRNKGLFQLGMVKQTIIPDIWHGSSQDDKDLTIVQQFETCFYVFQLGYLVFLKTFKRADHVMMLVHHCLSLGLIGLTNQSPPRHFFTLITLLLHNINDIPLTCTHIIDLLSKQAPSNTKSILIFGLLTITMLLWIMTRLVSFGSVIYLSWNGLHTPEYHETSLTTQYMLKLLFGMICFLWLMNAVWFGFISTTWLKASTQIHKSSPPHNLDPIHTNDKAALKRTILITGGSSGIGLAAAQSFPHDDVWIASRNPTKNQECLPSNVQYVTYNARSPAANTQLPSITPDILICCVGDIGPYGPTATMDPHAFTSMMELNFHSTVDVIYKYLPHMTATQHIITIGSQAGQLGLPTCSPYCASKAALNSFMQSLRWEQAAANGPCVSIINPPDTDTPQLQRELLVRTNVMKQLSPSFVSADQIVDDIHYLLVSKRYTMGCNVVGVLLNVLSKWTIHHSHNLLFT